MFNTHKCTNPSVALGLGNNPFLSICKNDSKIRKRCPYSHVAGIFFVSRCVCYDERTVVRRKITIRHVNRNSLLTLCKQPVKEQRIINFAAAAAKSGVQF
ncbi:hypothetical protein D3C85_1006270 [compost metagenome]